MSVTLFTQQRLVIHQKWRILLCVTIAKNQVLCFVWIESHFPINCPTSNLGEIAVQCIEGWLMMLFIYWLDQRSVICIEIDIRLDIVYDIVCVYQEQERSQNWLCDCSCIVCMWSFCWKDSSIWCTCAWIFVYTLTQTNCGIIKMYFVKEGWTKCTYHFSNSVYYDQFFFSVITYQRVIIYQIAQKAVVAHYWKVGVIIENNEWIALVLTIY